ncbi:hypothetical protein GCM10022251_38610 [Phytohabitans flavus]
MVALATISLPKARRVSLAVIVRPESAVPSACRVGIGRTITTETTVSVRHQARTPPAVPSRRSSTRLLLEQASARGATTHEPEQTAQTLAPRALVRSALDGSRADGTALPPSRRPEIPAGGKKGVTANRSPQSDPRPDTESRASELVMPAARPQRSAGLPDPRGLSVPGGRVGRVGLWDAEGEAAGAAVRTTADIAVAHISVLELKI